MADTAALIQVVGWADDGGLFYLRGETQRSRLFTISRDGSALKPLYSAAGKLAAGPDQFSADGRYLLAALAPPFRAATTTTWYAVDWGTDRAMAYEAGLLGAAWSPQGHLLALATPDGVNVVDVSTGAVRWVAIDRCDQVTWYRP